MFTTGGMPVATLVTTPSLVVVMERSDTRQLYRPTSASRRGEKERVDNVSTFYSWQCELGGESLLCVSEVGAFISIADPSIHLLNCARLLTHESTTPPLIVLELYIINLVAIALTFAIDSQSPWLLPHP